LQPDELEKLCRDYLESLDHYRSLSELDEAANTEAGDLLRDARERLREFFEGTGRVVGSASVPSNDRPLDEK
jgi:hypothetical protein